jgi:hypothetical protein
MSSTPDPDQVARRIREDNERRDRDQRRREIREAEDRGKEKQLIDNRLKVHEDTLSRLENIAVSLTHGQEEIERRVGAVEKAFGEFTAVAKALAENGITNRTFLLGVGMLLLAIIGLFIGVAKP